MNYPANPPSPQSLPAKTSAFVLAGGESRRMGQDKALLPVGGKSLLLHLAETIANAASSITVIGNPSRYDHLCRPLGISVQSDLRAAQGPLGGIETALATTRSAWNLVVACDMPFLSAAWMEELTASAFSQPADVLCVCSALLSPEQMLKPSPLCACWHKDALPLIRQALDAGHRRVQDLLPALNTKYLFPTDPQLLANWNSPADVQ